MSLFNLAIQGSSSLLGSVFGLTTDAIWNIFKFLIEFLPDAAGFPTGVHTAAVYFGAMLSKVSFIFPVDTLFTCLVLILTLKIGLYAFHIMLLIVNWIRGVPTQRYDGAMLWDGGPSARQERFWG